MISLPSPVVPIFSYYPIVIIFYSFHLAVLSAFCNFHEPTHLMRHPIHTGLELGPVFVQSDL